MVFLFGKPIWIDDWLKALIFENWDSCWECWTLANTLTSKGYPCYVQYRYQAKVDASQSIDEAKKLL